MAFTITFPTGGPTQTPDQIANWLTEQGEAFEAEGPDTLTLKALPLRLVIREDDGLQAQLEVDVQTPLSRLVDLLFALSFLAGADVKLAGHGAVSRPTLWMRLADEQDRLRIAQAVERAATHGNQEEVLNRLWRVLSALRPGRDDRWDMQRARIVEMKEVGAEGGITVEEAAWHSDDPEAGDPVACPLEGNNLHTLAWRWLSESYPGLAEITRH